MAVYMINIAVIAMLGMISRCRFRVRKMRISGMLVSEIVLFCLFTFIMALRGESVGTDTAPYSRIYGIIADSKSSSLRCRRRHYRRRYMWHYAEGYRIYHMIRSF